MEKTIKLGNKHYLIFEWDDYVTSASLSDPSCFREITEKVKEQKKVDGIIIKKSYKKIIEGESFNTLKEYISFLTSLPENPNICDDDFDEYSLFKFRAEEDPLGALRQLEEINPCEKDKSFFENIKKQAYSTKLGKILKKYWDRNDKELYHIIFRDRIIPAFISYHLEESETPKDIIEEYEIDGAEIKIAKSKNIKIYERKISPGELSKFVGCFLTGTAAEVTPVSCVADFKFKVCNTIIDLSEGYQTLVRKRKAA